MFLEVKNLSGGYGGKDVCKDLSCQVDRGEVLSVLGPNGCGKTTFFRLLLGFLPCSSGEIYIGGTRTGTLPKKELSRRIAYIPQYHNPTFSYTVLEVVLMSRASYFSAFSSPTYRDTEKAFEALEKLKIAHLSNQTYTSLSGGQRQMVLIARAICQNAGILVMDEPGSSLDYSNHQLLMDTISDLAAQGYSVVLSTHSPEHPFSVAHKAMLMKDGKIVSFGKTNDAITSGVLKEVYGVEMDIVSVTDRYGRPRTLCLPVKKASEKYM